MGIAELPLVVCPQKIEPKIMKKPRLLEAVFTEVRVLVDNRENQDFRFVDSLWGFCRVLVII
jgi:hypothetical protein